MNASDAGESSGVTADYQSAHRRSELAIPCLLAVAAIFGVGVITILRFVDSRATVHASLAPPGRG